MRSLLRASTPLACTPTSCRVLRRGQQRPGLAALLDYAREGDAIVVVGIDRLGRNAAEVMTTIRELGERGIVLRSLREGIDTSNATGRMVAGCWQAWPNLSWNWVGNAVQQRGMRVGHAGNPSVARRLDQSKVALAQRMHDSGESASTIAATLGVSLRRSTASLRTPTAPTSPSGGIQRAARHRRFRQ